LLQNFNKIRTDDDEFFVLRLPLLVSLVKKKLKLKLKKYDKHFQENISSSYAISSISIAYTFCMNDISLLFLHTLYRRRRRHAHAKLRGKTRLDIQLHLEGFSFTCCKQKPSTLDQSSVHCLPFISHLYAKECLFLI
jgi:hypothetical protein